MQHANFARPLMFHHTLPMPCPYLGGRTERRLVADIGGPRGDLAHDVLAKIGFRRTQTLVYRPACPSCAACIPVRVRVNDFIWSKGFKRNLKLNDDLIGELRPAATSQEQFELFQSYQQSRHDGGEMSHMSRNDYDDMITRSPINSRLLEYRERNSGKLLGVMFSDMQNDGFSAVYSFFDQAEAKRSLGKYMILDLIKRTKAGCKHYVYLGYWIAESRKMAYKTSYKPCEIFTNGQWHDYPSAPPPGHSANPDK